MQTIKINFVDFCPTFDYKAFFVYTYLSKQYNVVLSDNPDYLFCSCFGYQHWKYTNCIKIYYTSENIVPDFNIFDYGIGLQYLSLDDRYLRFPLWLNYAWDILDLMETKTQRINKELADRKFCNFVYTNSGWADPIRECFFKELSKYKKVDSGGKFLNNIGFSVPNKLDFIKDYKFTISIENSATSGYTTEKIIEPMMTNSIPIYYGDPHVNREFNMNSCVHLRDFDSISSAIDYIRTLDNNDNLYLDKLQECWFSYEGVKNIYINRIDEFFCNIFEQKKEDAIRIINFGFALRYRKEYKRTTPWANTFLIEKSYGLLDRLKKKYGV